MLPGSGNVLCSDVSVPSTLLPSSGPPSWQFCHEEQVGRDIMLSAVAVKTLVRLGPDRLDPSMPSND